MDTRISYNAYGQMRQVVVIGWSPQVGPGKSAQKMTRTTDYTYCIVNGRSVLTEINGPLPDGPLRSAADSDIVSLEYDATGSHVTKTLAPGNLSGEVLQRDEAQRPTLVRSGDGVRLIDKLTAYTALGEVSAITQTARFVTGKGSEEVLQRTTHFQHDRSGKLIKVVRPDGVVLRAEYDNAGRQVAFIDPIGNRIERSLDTEGKLLTSIVQDEKGVLLNGTFNLWDENNHMRAVLHPATIASAQSAPGAGGDEVRLDGTGSTTFSTVRGGQNIMAMPDRSTRQVRVSDFGIALADGAGRLHATLNDDFARVVLEIAPDEGRYYFEYEGNNVQKIHVSLDRKRSVSESLRYAASGLLQVRRLAGCTERLHYEGGLLRHLDGCGTSISYERDAFGAITRVHTFITAANVTAISAPTLQFSESFRYDQQSGRLTERRLLDGQRLSYRYNAISGALQAVLRDSGWLAWIDNRLGRYLAAALRATLPESMTEQSVLSHLQWRAFGGLGGATAFNGVTQKLEFDKAGRVNALRVGPGDSDTIESLQYEYDRAGLMTTSVRSGQQVHYRYDGMRRLTSERPAASFVKSAQPIGTAMLAPPNRRDIIYTPLGNRAGKEAQIPSRDSFGRESGNNGLRYHYDDAHRLTTVSREDGSIVARYRYDVRGNRIAKTVGGRTTYFLYDIGQRVVAEADQNGSINVQYLYSDHRPYSVMHSNGARQTRAMYAIHSDQRGLPLAVTDSRQDVVWRGKFDAFGNGTVSAPGAHNQIALNLRLAVQYEDVETGLYYNLHRYYNPRIGTYITPDPIGLSGGENPYAYVDSNPMLGIDPLGLFKIPLGAANGNRDYFVKGEVDSKDDGHGDIVRLAFHFYHKTNPNRFSQDIINQIIINNYYTDAENKKEGCLPVLTGINGGGQCQYTNHFDNPNASAGAPFKAIEQINPTTKHKMYTYTTEFRDTYTETTWIEDALDDIVKVRELYSDFQPHKLGVDISPALNAFGRNSHALADFYAHSNWVDSNSKGGCWQKTTWGKTVHGWVPEGLDQRVIWDEGLNPLETIYTGTVDDSWDILISRDKSTHGYWNKDDDKSGSNRDTILDMAETDQLTVDKMFYWTLHRFDPKYHLTRNHKKNDVHGWEAVIESSTEIKNGDWIFVAEPITTPHRIAHYLAVQHTIKEIDKLWATAAGKNLGNTGISMHEAFSMDQEKLGKRHIEYRRLWPKDQRP